MSLNVENKQKSKISTIYNIKDRKVFFIKRDELLNFEDEPLFNKVLNRSICKSLDIENSGEKTKKNRLILEGCFGDYLINFYSQSSLILDSKKFPYMHNCLEYNFLDSANIFLHFPVESLEDYEEFNNYLSQINNLTKHYCRLDYDCKKRIKSFKEDALSYCLNHIGTYKFETGIPKLINASIQIVEDNEILNALPQRYEKELILGLNNLENLYKNQIEKLTSLQEGYNRVNFG